MSTYKGVCRETVSLRAAACREVDEGGFENLASFDGDMYLQKISVLFFLIINHNVEKLCRTEFHPVYGLRMIIRINRLFS